MTQMYLGFASGGFLIPLRTTRSVLDQDMKPLARYPLSLEQAVDGDQVTVLNAGLQSVVARGTARSLNGRFPASLDLAGKTGTTNGYRDSWFAGYGGNYLAVVWIGRDDNKPTGLTGASGAMQIWADVMQEVHLQPVDIPVPASIEYVEIDQQGQVATGCQGAIALPFAPGTVPDRYASCAKPGKQRKVPAPAGKKTWLERLLDVDKK
jgi:penicillin-binding protein 1B